MPMLDGTSQFIGAHISAVLAKAHKNSDWSIDTAAEGYVDFFSCHAYPFRVHLDVDGMITQVSRPAELMHRYNRLVEARPQNPPASTNPHRIGVMRY